MFSLSENPFRYHLMIVRFCLSIPSKSTSAYKEFQDALGRKNGGILTLPSKRRLRDYKNWVRPKCGFSEDVIAEPITITYKWLVNSMARELGL